MTVISTRQQVMQITCIGDHHDAITADIIGLIEKYEGQLDSMRHINEHGRATLSIVIIGEWNQLNKIETALQKVVTTYPNHSIASMLAPFSEEPIKAGVLHYHINIIAATGSLVLPELYQFLRANDIALLQLSVDHYPRQIRQSGCMVLNAKVAIDMQFALSEIREQFIILCDSLNIDGIIDPARSY